MAFTKLNFYFGVIAVAIIVFMGIGYVGTSLSNNDRISLDEGSVDYILEVKGVNSQSGYESIADTSSGSTQLIDPLDSDTNTSVSDNNDFLSTLYIKKERASRPTNFVKIVYNIPTSVVRGLGFNVSDWNNYINVITYVFLVAIIIMIWREV